MEILWRKITLVRRFLDTIGKIVNALLFLLSCAFLISVNTTSFAQSSSRPTHRIGALLTLSGRLASVGRSVQNGLELALSEINAAGQLDLRIEYEDTRGETSAAISAAKKLVEVDKVRLIVGPIRSNEVLAIAPLSERARVIIFTPIAAADEITRAGDFVFRNRESARIHADAIARYFAQEKLQRIAIFVANSANSLSYGKALQTGAAAHGVRVIAYHEYEEHAVDFRAELAKIFGSDIQAFYLGCATGVDCATVVKQARELGYLGVILGNQLMDRPEFYRGAGSAADGVLFCASAFDINSGASKSFAQRYQARYGENPDTFAANSYDALKLLAAGIIACRGPDTVCIRDFLYATEDYAGAGGLTTFDRNGDVNKPIAFKKIEKGGTVVPVSIGQ